MASYAKAGLLTLGVLAVLLGIDWIGRGTGWFVLPAGNFMTEHMQWAFRGVGLVVGGLLIAFFSRRI